MSSFRSQVLRMYNPISVHDLDSVLSETFGSALTSQGFEQVDRRRWVRSTKAPIREVFAVLAMKGASYSPCWGVSLDFVPHCLGNSVRWHRTPKAARFDICFDPIDYTHDVGQWYVSRLDGVSVARKESTKVAKLAFSQALSWFDSVRTLEDLVREFEAKKHRPFVRFGFYNYVQEPLALAFVLARLGRFDEANEELRRYTERSGISDSVSTKLSELSATQQATAP